MESEPFFNMSVYFILSDYGIMSCNAFMFFLILLFIWVCRTRFYDSWGW